MKEMTREQVIEAGRKYDRIHNEGGEGYNPYLREMERREMEEAQKRVAEPKTKKQQIDDLYDKIGKECGSIAREWNEEEVDRKKAEYYDEIKKLEEEIEVKFASEWTREETQARRENWNGFIRTLINSNGRIDVKDQAKIYARVKDQGWGLNELKKAVKLHNLGTAK